MYYRKLLAFFFVITTIVAIMSSVASVQNSQHGMVAVLALPILLTIGLFVFVIIKWRH